MSNKIITLSFDDGREDLYRNAFPIMKKYGLASTCHIVTSLLDHTWEIPDRWETCSGAVKVEQLQEMRRSGHEISSHGDKHVTDIEDFKESVDKLVAMNLSESDLGFSVPDSNTKGDNWGDFANYLQSHNHRYIRGGWHEKILSSAFVLATYRLYRLLVLMGFHSFLCYRQFNKYNVIHLDKEVPRYMLPSLVVIRPEKAKTLIRFIEKLPDNVWLIIMLHSILDTNDPYYSKDYWCWSTENFDALCAYLSKRQSEGLLAVKTIAKQLEEYCIV